MRLWALLAAVLLCSMVLAGCSDDDGEGGDATSSSSSSSRASTSGSSSPSPTSASTTTTRPPGQPPVEPSNSAPTGSMSAVRAAANRTLNFTLNGTDPEGDNIVWDLQFGDGNSTSGALLPANVTHQYPALGLYNATFVITDGRLQATYNLTVNVTLAAPTGGAGGGFAFVGDVATWCSFCGDAATGGAPAIPSVSWQSGESGFDAVWTELPATVVAKPYTITSTAGQAAGAFMATCAGDAALIAEAPATGTVPAGAGCLLLWENIPVPPVPPGASTITVTI